MFYAAALVAVLNSVVSLYYYARVVRAMYIEPAGPDLPLLRLPAPLGLVLLALLVPSWRWVCTGRRWTTDPPGAVAVDRP